MNWSYRPFNNEYELLLVPAVSSSRLLARNTTDPRRYFGYVDSTVRRQRGTPDVYDRRRLRRLDQRPGSLSASLEFLRVGAIEQGRGLSAQLHRLFAYVGVPSRFANTQLQMRPDLAGQADGTPHYFHTPFNRISSYREPGRINLNTVTSADVLFGALNMYCPAPVRQNSS